MSKVPHCFLPHTPHPFFIRFLSLFCLLEFRSQPLSFQRPSAEYLSIHALPPSFFVFRFASLPLSPFISHPRSLPFFFLSLFLPSPLRSQSHSSALLAHRTLHTPHRIPFHNRCIDSFLTLLSLFFCKYYAHDEPPNHHPPRPYECDEKRFSAIPPSFVSLSVFPSSLSRFPIFVISFFFMFLVFFY